MATGHLLGGDSESLACDALLELEREEPIVATDEDASGNGRPARKVALGLEDRIRLK
jgi:hypothetical protein